MPSLDKHDFELLSKFAAEYPPGNGKSWFRHDDITGFGEAADLLKDKAICDNYG